MSRSAGTLQTTHQATYIPPRLMPGYKGHCPTMKFDYGETYANATAKYFQDYRSATLDNSKTNYSNGGQFPTVYTHNPDQVIGARDRTRERWRTEPKYSLSNVNHDRKEEVNRFDKLAQEHREHYKDRTGTVPRVNEFLIPRTAEQMYHQDSALCKFHGCCLFLKETLVLIFVAVVFIAVFDSLYSSLYNSSTLKKNLGTSDL